MHIMKKGIFCMITYIIVMLAPAREAQGNEIFTSVHDMEALAYLENRLLNTLFNYINKQEDKLRLVKNKLAQLTKVRPKEETVQTVIGDPVSAFSLVRRLTREWPLILSLVVNDISIEEDVLLLPKEEHLESAMRGLTRLQDVYTLDTQQLARQGAAVLTAIDLFELGKYLIKERRYEDSESWFIEALEKISIGDSTIQNDKVLTYLILSKIYSACKNRSILGSASNVLQHMISQYPTYNLDQDSAQLFRQALSVNCSIQLRPNKTQQDIDYEMYYEEKYRAGCQGLATNYTLDLRCYYVHYNNPQLLIGPFKMEELYLDPPILLFHDVISDDEIEEMREAYMGVKGKCQIFDGESFDRSLSYSRTCDLGWVEDEMTETAARLTLRARDMTNLSMDHSEPNQVASYGLGGEFMLHYDPLVAVNLTDPLRRDRLATLMFYLSDVESGGYTIFPTINVAVKPKKGSAVFWFNLDESSEALQKMLHGGCPVFKGSKWVLNKWIREAAQDWEFSCPADKVFPKPRYYMDGIK